VEPGKIPNIYKRIVCDPDEKRHEASAIGLLYTALSRATTLGDDSGLNSAIYFTGQDFDESRIREMTKKKDSDDDYEKIIKRKEWVAHIAANAKRTTAYLNATRENRDQKGILEWASGQRIPSTFLTDTIERYVNSMVLSSVAAPF